MVKIVIMVVTSWGRIVVVKTVVVLRPLAVAVAVASAGLLAVEVAVLVVVVMVTFSLNINQPHQTTPSYIS